MREVGWDLGRLKKRESPYRIEIKVDLKASIRGKGQFSKVEISEAKWRMHGSLLWWVNDGHKADNPSAERWALCPLLLNLERFFDWFDQPTEYEQILCLFVGPGFKQLAVSTSCPLMHSTLENSCHVVRKLKHPVKRATWSQGPSQQSHLTFDQQPALTNSHFGSGSSNPS